LRLVLISVENILEYEKYFVSQISDTKLIALIKRKKALNQPFIGIFIRKNIDT
jgi:hypothetical protein